MLSFLSANPREISAMPSVPDRLLALAPLHLVNHRKSRYNGDDLFVILEGLAGADQSLLRDLYRDLSELIYLIADKSTDDAQKWRDIAGWTRRHEVDGLIDAVQQLGRASHAQAASEALAKAMHDLRGGALTALLGRLQLIGMGPSREGDLNTLFVLARDHLKIMRSAVVGLDEVRREADHTPKSHDVRLILEKWHESVVGPKTHEQPIQMFIDCRYEGALTECCLESAAVDRIFYNLANNACRHAAGGRLDMVIFPLPDAPEECLRLVLSNEVNGTDAEFLRSLLSHGADSTDRGRGASLHPLYEPAVSSTGSGFGLTVVADFVTHAFGLENRREALRERYVGAVLDGKTFHTWFHWPVASNALPRKLDDYHRPEESLSGG